MQHKKTSKNVYKILASIIKGGCMNFESVWKCTDTDQCEKKNLFVEVNLEEKNRIRVLGPEKCRSETPFTTYVFGKVIFFSFFQRTDSNVIHVSSDVWRSIYSRTTFSGTVWRTRILANFGQVQIQGSVPRKKGWYLEYYTEWIF